jgi:hypothetical protein
LPRALGAARSGDAAAAERDVQELERIVDALKVAKRAGMAASAYGVPRTCSEPRTPGASSTTRCASVSRPSCK